MLHPRPHLRQSVDPRRIDPGGSIARNDAVSTSVDVSRRPGLGRMFRSGAAIGPIRRPGILEEEPWRT
jgi:hypothetical protein